MYEIDEVNDEVSDGILHNNNLQVELAIQITSNDETVRINTVQNLKEFNTQSLTILAKKGEQLVFMMLPNKKPFDSMGNDIVELSTKNESLKNKIGPRDEKWLKESEAKLLKQIDDDKRANSIMSRMGRQMKKQY